MVNLELVFKVTVPKKGPQSLRLDIERFQQLLDGAIAEFIIRSVMGDQRGA